jgi:hypothetical protein
VPIDREARHRREARGDRGVAGHDATAVEPLTEDDVVDLGGADLGYSRSDDVLCQLVSVGVAQRALHGSADRRTQGRHDDSFRHGCLRFV